MLELIGEHAADLLHGHGLLLLYDTYSAKVWSILYGLSVVPAIVQRHLMVVVLIIINLRSWISLQRLVSVSLSLDGGTTCAARMVVHLYHRGSHFLYSYCGLCLTGFFTLHMITCATTTTSHIWSKLPLFISKLKFIFVQSIIL